MPQATVDPVVLAAMIVVRLQTVVSRETPPGQTAVLTVGSVQAGTKSNIIPDHAVLQLNIRTYSEQTRRLVLDAVRRIVTAECQASGCPKDPDFELFDRFPVTDNDAVTTERVAGVNVGGADTIRGNTEDDILLGGSAGDAIDGNSGDDLIFGDEVDLYRRAPIGSTAPDLNPGLDTGTQALVVAALAWLAH